MYTHWTFYICLLKSRYCKCWEYPLWYDPLRFILSFSICYHHLLFFTELQTTTGSLKRLFFNWSFQFTHIEHFTFAFLKSRYCKRYPKMQNPKPPNRKFGHDLAAFRAPHAENNGVSIQRPCSMQFFWLKFHSSLFVSSIDPSLKNQDTPAFESAGPTFFHGPPPKKMMPNQRPVTSSLASSGPTFETTSTQCCRKGGIEVSEKKILAFFQFMDMSMSR